MPETSIENPINPAAPATRGLSEAEKDRLRESADQAARTAGWIAEKRRSGKPREIFRSTAKKLATLEEDLYQYRSGEPSDDVQWLYDNLRLVRTELHSFADSIKHLSKLPQVRTAQDESIPRCFVLSRALVAATDNRISEETVSFFIDAVQKVEPLRLLELGGMLPALKLTLLDLIADRGREALEAFRRDGAETPPFGIGHLITSLRLIGELDWKERLEELSIIHKALLLDPADVYGGMDFESRSYYRETVAKIAAHSDIGEHDVARLAVKMAESALIDRSAAPALRDRLRHVGYYLLDSKGSAELLHRANHRPSVGYRLQGLFRQFPDELYIIGIEVLTLLTVVVLIMSIVRSHGAWGLILSALMLLLPATQAAVELMNYLVSTILTPRMLPKIDFSKGVDPEAATIVAIPTLLLNEKQIRGLVDDLEVRYLVNRDPNIFFAILSDLPDTAEPAGEHDARIELALELIEGLNRRYAELPYGGFYLFHRHRIFNPREGAWMGWERKRGKLLDLNQLLRKSFDPFPVKAGDMSRLRHIQYVLTLDSDTQLPRGSAQKMIGTMAHPLNRPLIDPNLNIVSEGYGILQPRVGISVHSATRSRLASIYSGQTGFDIYSRAVSDVYQDLYGEGIFTGKGIYDVDALRQVLEHRFPRNALLSHDLIEGAYARAGLVSDIEVIDDYPSHYSAYNRRRHRWLRGDWQIIRWLLNRVPNESRRLVANPISLASRWKIADNLRRSLVEPATFLLLITGWFILPGGPRFWTLITLYLLFLPIYFRLLFSFFKALFTENWLPFRDSWLDFLTSHVSIFLNIVFLAHQSVVAIDAIARTVIRSYITHTRLLEWETATEAELGIKKRTPVDIYLDWMPALGVILIGCLYFRPEAAPYALPFIVLWSCSQLISKWLNGSPHARERDLNKDDRRFLHELSLRTWRYFSHFSNEGNGWLIPDNVQEQPYRIAERLSPTNLGLLLNSRQAAVTFGYLTVPEFVVLTERTLTTALKLPRQFGHLLNWYDNLTLKPIEPQFVSSVDSGNFAASLWTLKQGCLEALHHPLIDRSLLKGLADHARLLDKPFGDWAKLLQIATLRSSDDDWISQLLSLSLTVPATAAPASWWGETIARVEAIRELVREYAPWCLRENKADGVQIDLAKLEPASADVSYMNIARQLPALSTQIAACQERAKDLARRIQKIADECERLVQEMDFSKVADKRRNLLSIGYNVTKNYLEKSCYDLLASESRIAAFVAVAKNDVEQENWFRLGRQHTICEGQKVLISWTGTMFEYLMPVIWMRSHPETLLDRTATAAVNAQQLYASNRRVPWGISEAAYSKTDADGNYQYAAFGVPGMALNVARAGSLVVSPYSSCLALMVDPAAALENLRAMAAKKWLSQYGFFESADYTDSPKSRFFARKSVLVRCWMVHHHGMSLAALCNMLHDWPFQRWFHAEPRVQASELILQERPLRVRPITDVQPRRVLTFDRKSPKGPLAKVKNAV